ncbi:MAG TPA: pantoate--beta-alanine ligase, partial [Rubrobacteraceae bacterium]|nr:pantoate--beta-alanine ligase [Rubrobacteraceae bacterium]
MVCSLGMQIVDTPEEMQSLSRSWRRDGELVGFVATMGALHDGHLSLARAAREQCDRFVASIFVNPLQFEAREDLEKYERPFDRDCRLLREAGCDAVFTPSVEDMYGARTTGSSYPVRTFVEVEGLGDVLEGKTRPGHFRGVATIVAKLFNIVDPQRAYFGEKDYQQFKVIEQMVHDLFLDVEIVPCSTVREEDGLAMSSRNARLTPDERKAATVLSQALREGVALARDGERNAAKLVETMRALCEAQPL